MKMPRSMLVILAVVVCSLFFSAPALASVSLNKYESQLLTLVNKARAKHGLAKLRVDAKLTAAARSHSAEMGEAKYFDHASYDPQGECWSSRLVRFGYTQEGCSSWKAGENIYWGAGLFSSPVVCFDRWMKSKAHRAVILTRAFRQVGLGAVSTDSGFGGADGVVWFFTLDAGRRVLQ